MPFDLDGISAVTHGPQSFFNDFFTSSFKLTEVLDWPEGTVKTDLKSHLEPLEESLDGKGGPGKWMNF
ncbi:hypothetical protein [Caldibacillus debilis]|jgi:hypothetical protein|uniref:hypothetical protein n=1 Tax=Caldibacillus debilis TaxID=301148 RepID=UPI000368F7E9|nr:hypothetical protein [Caldibacillus debilis]